MSKRTESLLPPQIIATLFFKLNNSHPFFFLNYLNFQNLQNYPHPFPSLFSCHGIQPFTKIEVSWFSDLVYFPFSLFSSVAVARGLVANEDAISYMNLGGKSTTIRLHRCRQVKLFGVWFVFTKLANFFLWLFFFLYYFFIEFERNDENRRRLTIIVAVLRLLYRMFGGFWLAILSKPTLLVQREIGLKIGRNQPRLPLMLHVKKFQCCEIKGLVDQETKKEKEKTFMRKWF